MKISKALAYTNIAALIVNGITVWLVVTKNFPPMLGITLFVGFFVGATWLSVYINKQPAKKAPPAEFYSEQTVEVRVAQ